MSFVWDEIQNGWLYQIPVPFSREEIIKAFNHVEKTFGSDFFDKYSWIRGTYITTLIVNLSTVFEEVEKGKCKLPANGEIMRKIRRNDIPSIFTLIGLAAHYLRNDLLVDFEPSVLVRESKKRPDLRVRFSKNWVYIEEFGLNLSQRYRLVTEVMEHISSVLEDVNSNLNIEVSLLKDRISIEELNQITSEIQELSGTAGQPNESSIQDLAQIMTYKKGQEKPSIKEQRPALCMATLNVGGGFERHLNVQVPFTDIRIEKVLKKSKQLSPKEHNMIILDISIPGNLRIWSESIKKMFQSDKLHRIGAVLLIENSRTVKSFKVNTDLVTHPNPSNPLLREFIQLTTDHFRQQTEYCYNPRV
jgi:regulator of replication initiation timing